MKFKVFVDGQEGTTGLKINERLEKRNDIIILRIDPEKRKDASERSRLLNEADIAFLCLPDAAATEAVRFVQNPKTRIIDASTAHRTAEGWVYGLPELSPEHREAVRTAKKLANPGCYATGFNLLTYPLVKEGILPADYPVTCHAVSGYSGGGKKLIERYRAPGGPEQTLESPQFYALGLTHKHIPEMTKVSGLMHKPLFSPIVDGYYQGMTVAVPLHLRLLKRYGTAEGIHEFFSEYYKGQYYIKIMPFELGAVLPDGFLNETACNDTNRVEIFISGNEEQVMVTARFDNLGKGASGAAIQNMNIMLGLDETTGLE